MVFKNAFPLVFVFAFISFNEVKSQCTAMPSEPACSGSLLASSTNVNSGQTYYYNGGTLTSINMSGGTIIMCSGTTTLSGNFSSGIIYIKTGATLNTSINNIGSGCSLYNYGTTNFTSGIGINSANAFMNAYSSHINVTGNISGQSCSLVNYGGVIATGTLGDWQNSGGVCQGDAAQMSVANINWTSIDTWFDTPVGSSCISYSGTATSSNSHPFTADAGTNICQKVGASNVTGTGGWGSGTLTQSCASCTALLPVELISFTAECDLVNSENIKVEWTTASELNNAYFEIEQSTDLLNFKTVDYINGAGNSTSVLYYSRTLTSFSGQSNYFRLKQTDFDGKSSYSKIVAVYNCNQTRKIKVLNNRFVVDNESSYWDLGELYDVTGRLLKTYNFSNYPKGITVFELNDLSSAMYVLKLSSSAIKMEER